MKASARIGSHFAPRCPLSIANSCSSCCNWRSQPTRRRQPSCRSRSRGSRPVQQGATGALRAANAGAFAARRNHRAPESNRRRRPRRLAGAGRHASRRQLSHVSVHRSKILLKKIRRTSRAWLCAACALRLRCASRSNAGQPALFHDGRQSYKIATSFGPWRSSGCWWSVDGWDSDEWDVLAESQGAPVACLLVMDRGKHEWRLEAFYD